VVICGTLLFAAVDFQALHYKPMFASWLSFAGLSSLATVGVRTHLDRWCAPQTARLRLYSFRCPCYIGVFASTFLEWTASAHPKSSTFICTPSMPVFGLQLPFLVGQRFVVWPWLGRASALFYIGLPIPIALVYSSRLLRLREKALPSFVAFLATGPVGVLFYNLFQHLGLCISFCRVSPGTLF